MAEVDIRKTLAKIRTIIERGNADAEVYQDYFDMVRVLCKEDKAEGYVLNGWLRNTLSHRIRTEPDDNTTIRLYEILKKTYLLPARDDFHSYLIYLEWSRPAEQRFYQPRMKIMRRLVDALQRLTDGDLDELFLSMAPRVGKTTMLMFYATWLVGREPERSNLYSAYSDVITSAFYSGCLEVINDPTTYLWHDVFPEAKIVSTNAKDETFNVDRKKRYPSLTCRSLYGTLNGACDCNGVLISDDLIGGIEEALSKDRLISAWTKVDNNLLPRAKESAKVLWCGTRWSVADPAGLRMDLLNTDDKFKNRRFEIINLPALDENEQSNFEYQYNVGFSTDYYLQRRASFEKNNDLASWSAQYMGEPVERSGVLFEPQDMRYYNGILPDEDRLVRKFMAVDPAFGGGDFTSAPICYQYEDGSIYIADVVYNDGDKRITQPLIISMIKKHGIQAVQFEANRSTASYKEAIDEALRADGYKLNITSKAAPNNASKEARIYDRSPDIREFYFLESGKRPKEYTQFMQNVFAFKITGKNKHDDSVDSLAMAVDMIRGIGSAKVEVCKRPF